MGRKVLQLNFDRTYSEIEPDGSKLIGDYIFNQVYSDSSPRSPSSHPSHPARGTRGSPHGFKLQSEKWIGFLGRPPRRSHPKRRWSLNSIQLPSRLTIQRDGHHLWALVQWHSRGAEVSNSADGGTIVWPFMAEARGKTMLDLMAISSG